LITVEDPVYGEFPMQGQPWKATETPPRMKWACRPPGHDNAHIYLRHLGLGGKALAVLHKRGVI
jgi:crotonobetainyl-CoA:carnitine CoA-transferase CaiB-like acyl-CoA transferase